MEVRNCAKCGKIFTNGLSQSILCPMCRKQDEKEFKRVKEYLYQNPCTNILEVSTALGISISKLRRYLREERLETASNTASTLLCEKCGTSINSGRYCTSCTNHLSNQIKSAFTADHRDREPIKATAQNQSSNIMKPISLRQKQYGYRK
ncbi:MAG: hypothetical protein PWP27_2278 [Clostridiales bacterium]|jgi:predicted  nucleic acid-binding Zn-ribbon protein|nr:hypothetical protein [Clostridiales bacterium]